MQESETRFTEKGAEAIGEEARTAPASSKLLAGFGSVIPNTTVVTSDSAYLMGDATRFSGHWIISP